MGAPRASRRLAASITRAASTQSYLTIRWLADRERRADAYALYAYFRWLDDSIDERLNTREDRLAFVARQRGLLAAARAQLAASPAPTLTATAASLEATPEETLLLALAASTAVADATGGLGIALDAMLDLMDLDAKRRGTPLADDELDAYTRTLAVAVAESLHHCIGHGSGAATGDARYAAVEGAHVAHMLRDLAEDLELGFLNAPAQLLNPEHPELTDLHSEAMCAWVRDRVGLARARFATGRQALAQAEHWRCRLAGHAYIARFEWVLDTIEADEFRLRRGYPERATWRGGLKILADAARSASAASAARRGRA